MSYQIIDGKAIAGEIKEECRVKAEEYREKGIEITLAVVLGDLWKNPLTPQMGCNPQVENS